MARRGTPVASRRPWWRPWSWWIRPGVFRRREWWSAWSWGASWVDNPCIRRREMWCWIHLLCRQYTPLPFSRFPRRDRRDGLEAETLLFREPIFMSLEGCVSTPRCPKRRRSGRQTHQIIVVLHPGCATKHTTKKNVAPPILRTIILGAVGNELLKNLIENPRDVASRRDYLQSMRSRNIGRVPHHHCSRKDGTVRSSGVLEHHRLATLKA